MPTPDPTGTPVAKQVDDHVQNSMMGAVKPLAEHPGSGRLVPVSAATPDAEPKAERVQPPQKTGHDIGHQVENSSTTPAVGLIPDPLKVGAFITKEELDERNSAQGAYAKLPKQVNSPASDAEVMSRNAAGAAEKDSKANSATGAPVDKGVESRDTPFPRATHAQPVQGVTGPKNAATDHKS